MEDSHNLSQAIPYAWMLPSDKDSAVWRCASGTYDSRSNDNISISSGSSTRISNTGINNTGSGWSTGSVGVGNAQSPYNFGLCGGAAGNVSDPYNKYASTLSPTGDVLVAVYLLLLEFFAVLFNGFVIGLSIWKRKSLKTSDSFVVCLALSDIGHPIAAYPLIIVSSFKHGWIFGDEGCLWNGFTGFFFGVNSMMTLAMMSLNRLLIITDANFARRHARAIASCLLGLSLSFALFWSLSPVLGWGEYGPEPYKTSCTLVWEQPDKSFVTASFIGCLAVPSVVMIYSYGKIVYLAALMRHRRLKWAVRTQEKKIWETKEVRLLKVTGIMCITFLLFWTPYAVVAMIKSYARHIHLPVELSVVPALAAKTSHVIDPLIYCLLNRNFNQHIPVLFKSRSSKSEKEFTTQSMPLKTIAGLDEKVDISSEA